MAGAAAFRLLEPVFHSGGEEVALGSRSAQIIFVAAHRRLLPYGRPERRSTIARENSVTEKHSADAASVWTRYRREKVSAGMRAARVASPSVGISR
ncbi:hypothetical protein D7231_32930 [Streptomyces klenkii]|uniref:Uncharacterized protein n=1 Tax=Streptomyces klenkii TaxID=1420899 RepID=A0A3B0ANC0_9ACTN|nr:hypothetical protein D7231_32930 [Streptomyces klenkii]